MQVKREPAPPPRLSVKTGDQLITLDQTFCIGRSEECQVRIQNEYVSRKHVAVEYSHDRWQVTDLNSSNGIFIDGQRVTTAAVDEKLTIRLGIGGPFLEFSVEAPPPPVRAADSQPDSAKLAEYAERYFGDKVAPGTMGEHTRMVRRAFSAVQKRQRRRYTAVVAALLLSLLVVAVVAVLQFRRASRQTAMAQDLFYAMKALDVDIARVQKVLMDSGDPQATAYAAQYRQRRREMEGRYNNFLASLGVYDPKLSQQDRLILRVARIFGECELAMPPEFKREVYNYIGKWRSSDRFARAVALARDNGYTDHIVREFLKENLPPQFFYLALQESDFDQYTSGPETYKGIAKGMWQFIPETAMKYGLRIGPLVDARRPDPSDERHQWQKATGAAVRYIKDIYSTDAQASGLLVMASYNWGENRVVRLLRSMPANPRDRNFWKVLTQHRDKIPDQTYDYVFYIVSAAVIGENPRLFGFSMDNPLAGAESR
jgi:hypothetical protein